jgi:hypothetical protein
MNLWAFQVENSMDWLDLLDSMVAGSDTSLTNVNVEYLV